MSSSWRNTFRLTFKFSSSTLSYNSYLVLPADFWKSRSLEQLGLSSVPIDNSLCWSIAPSNLDSVGNWSRIEMDFYDSSQEENDCVPFVVGTSVVASGVIHLSRIIERQPDSNRNTVRVIQPKEQEPGALKVIYDFHYEGNVVLIPAIPSLITPADFLAFIKDAGGIIDLRLVKDASPGKYMALLRFQNYTFASDFFSSFSDKPFSSLEPELCHVLFVGEIEFNTNVDSVISLFDQNDFKNQVGIIQNYNFSFALEVPTCPVCLERLDASISGIITTICNHTFHCMCLSKWSDGSCPVCRFLLSSQEEPDADGAVCLECGSRENLWICLICGNVGCGRYKSRHATDHFEATGHNFSLELESHRVWDYVGDNYVHRLVQNGADGKLVEVGSPVSVGHSEHEKKNEDPDYFSSLLVAQLESQRIFYEEKMCALETSLTVQAKSRQQESNSRIVLLQESVNELVAKLEAEEKHWNQKIKALEGKIETLRKEKADLIRQQQNDNSVMERLLKNQAMLEKIIEEKDHQIADLQDQLKDLLMHIEGQRAIEKSDMVDELRIGSIRLVESPEKRNPPSKHTGAHTNRRKKK